MSASYSGNPNDSAKDALRFKIGDTDMTNPMLTDAEIQYLLDNFSGPRLYAEAFEQCVTYLAARAVKKKLGPQSEDASDRLQSYKEKAAFYRRHAAYGTLPPLPEYQDEKVFEKGMMANDA